MALPDSNAGTTSSKYNVQIGQAQGTVIGDNVHVEQRFYGSPLELPIDLAAAEATYRQKVVDLYKWLDFGGFARSDLSLANVPLEEVFVRLSLTVEKVIRELVPPERPSHTWQRESWQRERVITKQEPIELGQALGNHLLIVGEPGAGKSTLLRWLAVTFAEVRQREPNRLGPAADADRLPVLVELGRLPDRFVKPEGGEFPNWIQLLPEYLASLQAFADTPPLLLSRALADGRCLLLFDGLDEVADRQARTRIARSLAELARLFPGNQVIIGSRPSGVSESEGALRPQFQRCQIQRFTPDDVQRFFRFWYALDRSLTTEQQRDAADTLYVRVHAAPATLELASTPLLSTILVLIWRNEGDLPKRRVDLYERCCRVLIEHWERHHDVAYQGIFTRLGWERHLHLLAPLAYDIHEREEHSAIRTNLIEPLAKSLQVEGICRSEVQAKLEAEQFLETMGLRSGLLQDLGDDRYGFPHQTFQEYLVARYISAQSDPKYIDLVMEHLHEAWWREVHLLTIAHLGSGSASASKASTLILTILHLYSPPSWILRSSRNRWLRLISPGKLLPQVQLARRIAWMQAREFELAARGYAECTSDGTTTQVGTALSAQAGSLLQDLLYDRDRREAQESLLTLIGQFSQRQGNEAVVNALLVALHNADWKVREQAAQILGQAGVGNEAVVNALLEAYANGDVGTRAAESLGKLEAGNEAVVSALLKAALQDDWEVRWSAAESLGQVGAGNEAVISALLVALHDPDLNVRTLAARTLGQAGAGNEAVISALLEALHDPDWEVQLIAAGSLGQVGAGNEAVVSALLAALHDRDGQVRGQVAGSLAQMGVSNEAVVSALLESLHETGLNIGYNMWRLLYQPWQAAEALGKVGAGNEAVVSALLVALHDPDWSVRRQAAEGLGHLEIKSTMQLHQALLILNCWLDAWGSRDRVRNKRQVALVSIRQLLDGRPIPGYRWVPLQKRQARVRSLKRFAILAGFVAVFLLVALTVTFLDPNSLIARWVTSLSFLAGIVSIIGVTLRDLWDRKQSNRAQIPDAD